MEFCLTLAPKILAIGSLTGTTMAASDNEALSRPRRRAARDCW